MRIFLLLLPACFGGGQETESVADNCEDSTGVGQYSGPNLLGGWTTTFAQNFYDDTCSEAGFNENTQDWIGAMHVDGTVPSAFYMYFGMEQGDELFWGSADKYGGVSFSGRHVESVGTIHAQFGGFAHHDQYLDRDTIVGSAFLGLDVDDDGTIDCYGRGSWTALKSGQ